MSGHNDGYGTFPAYKGSPIIALHQMLDIDEHAGPAFIRI